MEKGLKILHLEDSRCDVMLAQAALAAEGIKYEPIIAVNREQFSAALLDASLDLIISDYFLPTFDGLTALAMTREIYPDLPFIFLTGTMGEERASASLKSGATDFVLKGRLGRLGQTVRRALKSQEDQSALWQTADLLRIENERFRILSTEFKTLLDGIPDKITLRSPDCKLLWANKSAFAAWNGEEKEVVGRHCYEVLHNRRERCECCPAVECFRTGECVTAIVTSPNKSIWELRTIPICDAGSVISVIEIARDISAQRRLEDRYFQAQKLETVGTLASGIAHDFNNILTCINGYGQLVSRGMDADNPLRTYINIILDAADRAARLTGELLQFSKKQPGEQKSVDLNSVIKTAEKFFIKVISENIEVSIQLQDKPLQILADRHQLEQVLMNLTTNASDAMARYENGLYTIRTEQVTLNRNDTNCPGNYALLTVSDTGEGMEPETQQRIFEPFFTTKEVGKGTGLGLAAVYGIIKQHGGEINLTSEANKGTTFRIYLPLITAKAQDESSSDPEEAHLGGTETILLAEDDALVRAMAITFLTDYGYSVIEAENGEEAVQIFLQNQNTIDLLLFDLIMPKMNGLEACAEIQKLRPGIKALIASGYLPELQEKKTVPENGICMVEKPYNPKALLQKVRSLLDMVE